MKKRLTAIVALAAMLLTLLPATVFAADASTSGAQDAKINIEAINFNNNTQAPYDNVIIRITGDDVKGSYSVVTRVNGEMDYDATGELNKFYSSGNEYLIYIPKSEIENIGDATKANTIAVTIMDANWSEVVASENFTQSYVPTLPQEMTLSMDNKIGNTDRTLTVKFDANFVPASGDEVILSGYDADGDRVGTQQHEAVTNSKLTETADGMRTMTIRDLDLDQRAETVQAVFERNGDAVSALTQEVSLEPPYGELDEILFDFGGTTVVPGQTVTGTLTYVNTDGERYDITDEADVYIFNAPTGTLDSSETETPTFTVSKDAKPGTSITCMAAYGGENITKVLTVVDDVDPGDVRVGSQSLTADGKDHDLTFTLVDEDGKDMKLDFMPSNIDFRWIPSASSDNAVVTFGQNDNGASLQSKGTIITKVKADKATTGKFQITFTDGEGHSYQVLSDTFRFTDPKAQPERVELTIGSTTMRVDGVNHTMDVAPVVSQSRTFIPHRAVAEAVGGTVNYENGVITIDQGENRIVMTIGSQNYTVNGEAKTMDVAPYINASVGRAMVPFRALGEALGYEVTPQYNADGTTRGVLFELKK